MHRLPVQELSVRSLRLMFQNFADPVLVEAWQEEPNAGLDGRAGFVINSNTLGGQSAIGPAHFSRPPAQVRPLH